MQTTSRPLRDPRSSSDRLWAVLAGALALASVDASAAPPPSGRAGQCFQEVRLAPTYRTVEVQEPQAPMITFKRTPAVYAPATRQVLATPARTVYDVVPAVYKTVARYGETEGPARLAPTAAVYRMVSERVLIAPAHLEWRRSRSAEGFSGDGSAYDAPATPTGEVLCRVLVPARYAWSRHRVMVSPPGVRRIPGVRRRVVCYVKVLVRPAQRIPRRVPATYRTETYQRLVTPAGCVKTTTPRPPRTVKKRVIAVPAHMVWRPIVCRPAHGPHPAPAR